MASITITSSNITVTGNNLTVNYTTDVTLTKVELTNGSSDYITASTFNQSSATFNIATWDNGTYTSCLLRVTYEITNSYGQIVLSRNTISLNEAATNTFSVKLDKGDLSDEIVKNGYYKVVINDSLTLYPYNFELNQIFANLLNGNYKLDVYFVNEEANINLEDINYTLRFTINIVNNLNQTFAYNMKLDVNLDDNNGGIYNGYIYKSKSTSGNEYRFFREVN